MPFDYIDLTQKQQPSTNSSPKLGNNYQFCKLHITEKYILCSILYYCHIIYITIIHTFCFKHMTFTLVTS